MEVKKMDIFINFGKVTLVPKKREKRQTIYYNNAEKFFKEHLITFPLNDLNTGNKLSEDDFRMFVYEDEIFLCKQDIEKYLGKKISVESSFTFYLSYKKKDILEFLSYDMVLYCFNDSKINSEKLSRLLNYVPSGCSSVSYYDVYCRDEYRKILKERNSLLNENELLQETTKKALQKNEELKMRNEKYKRVLSEAPFVNTDFFREEINKLHISNKNLYSWNKNIEERLDKIEEKFKGKEEI